MRPLEFHCDESARVVGALPKSICVFNQSFHGWRSEEMQQPTTSRCDLKSSLLRQANPQPSCEVNALSNPKQAVSRPMSVYEICMHVCIYKYIYTVNTIDYNCILIVILGETKTPNDLVINSCEPSSFASPRIWFWSVQWVCCAVRCTENESNFEWQTYQLIQFEQPANAEMSKSMWLPALKCHHFCLLVQKRSVPCLFTSENDQRPTKIKERESPQHDLAWSLSNLLRAS